MDHCLIVCPLLFWPLHCLSFFDLRFLMISLVSSNFCFYQIHALQSNIYIFWLFPWKINIWFYMVTSKELGLWTYTIASIVDKSLSCCLKNDYILKNIKNKMTFKIHILFATRRYLSNKLNTLMDLFLARNSFLTSIFYLRLTCFIFEHKRSIAVCPNSMLISLSKLTREIDLIKCITENQ